MRAQARFAPHPILSTLTVGLSFMLNFRPVNIPCNILKDHTSIIQMDAPYFYNIHDTSILTNEVQELFKSLDITPKFVVAFINTQQSWTVKERVIHSDLSFFNGKWNPNIASINYELLPVQTEMSWWELKDRPPVYPDIPTDNTPFEYRTLNGIHYGTRRFMGDNNAFLIEKAKVVEPTLIRTDLPHSLIRNHYSLSKRVAISIRFHESWNSWEEALEKFKPIYRGFV